MDIYHLLEVLLVLAALGLAGWYLLRRFLRTKRAAEKGSACGCSCGGSCPVSRDNQTNGEP